VQTTAIWMHFSAQPAPADLSLLCHRPLTEATVGNTQSATIRARWSWSTLPYPIPMEVHQVKAAATTKPASRGSRFAAATRHETHSTAYSVMAILGLGSGRWKMRATIRGS
jgi:hypothetical protein